VGKVSRGRPDGHATPVADQEGPLRLEFIGKSTLLTLVSRILSQTSSSASCFDTCEQRDREQATRKETRG
jgi:hypothetical protein